jgi:hypothetical protein
MRVFARKLKVSSFSFSVHTTGLDANVVKEISLYIDTAWSLENRTFMDLLPDAITKLSGCSDGARLMERRQKVLEQIKLKVEDSYDAIKDAFQSICELTFKSNL